METLFKIMEGIMCKFVYQTNSETLQSENRCLQTNTSFIDGVSYICGNGKENTTNASYNYI